MLSCCGIIYERTVRRRRPQKKSNWGHGEKLSTMQCDTGPNPGSPLTVFSP